MRGSDESALDEHLRQAARRVGGRRPVVVVLVAGSRDTFERQILRDERTVVALQRFARLRGNVDEIPGEGLRAALLRRTPIVRFYDPSGKLCGGLERSSALSRARFLARLKAVWSASYELPFRDYVKRRLSLLDDLGAVRAKLEVMRTRLAAAGDGAAKILALRSEQEGLLDEESRLRAEETRLIRGPDLREEFLVSTSDAGAPPPNSGRSLRGASGR